MNTVSSKKAYQSGVSVIVFTLNNASSVEGCIQSVVDNTPDQIIVVDGGSTDQTVSIAKRYTDEVYITEPGFFIQTQLALSKVDHEYFLSIECDQRFPKGFIDSLLNEFRGSGYFGMQGTLECICQGNYLERGMSVFYQIHQQTKGEKDIIAGPAIYKSQDFVENFYFEESEGMSLKDVNGYSIDTQMAELKKRKKFKVALAHSIAYQKQPLDLRVFIKKFSNYGKGDYDFYQKNASSWTLSRKLKSVTHVFRQYVIRYPWRAVKLGKPQYVPYFWITALIRYGAWAKCYWH